jgi:hypothetical protein
VESRLKDSRHICSACRFISHVLPKKKISGACVTPLHLQHILIQCGLRLRQESLPQRVRKPLRLLDIVTSADFAARRDDLRGYLNSCNAIARASSPLSE